MSNETVGKRVLFQKLSAIVGALAAALLLSCANEARAWQEIWPPANWGDSVQVIVAKDSLGDDPGTYWVIYQPDLYGSPQNCWPIPIGDTTNGLWDDTIIHGTSGADELYIPSSYDWEGCGGIWSDPGDMKQGSTGRALEILLHAGSDYAWVNNNPYQKVDLGLGTSASNKILAGNGRKFVGGNGPDVFFTFQGPNLRVYGWGGDDRFCAMYNGPWLVMDGGGDGYDQDRSYGTATTVVDVESPGSLVQATCTTEAQGIINRILD